MWFPRSALTARRTRCPALPLRHRHGYAADLPHGLPADPTRPARESPVPGCAPQSDPYPQVGGRRTRLRGVDAGSSLAPFRLACRTRAVWRCRPVPSSSGLLSPLPAPPGSGCPQLQPTCCDRPVAESFHLRTVRWRLVAHDGASSGCLAHGRTHRHEWSLWWHQAVVRMSSRSKAICLALTAPQLA